MIKRHEFAVLICLLAGFMVSCAGPEEPDSEGGSPAVAEEAAKPVEGGVLAAKLSALRAASAGQMPAEAKAVMVAAEEALREQGLVGSALQVGARAPLFELKDSTGKTIRMYQYLQNGPVVVVFYRGGWCPYCNLQLQEMQAVLPDLKALGATLLAVTPDNQAGTSESVATHQLGFPVLTDQDNAVARAFGLVFELPPALDEIYKGFGIDLKARNNTGTSELPLAATYVIAQNGVVSYAYLDEAYYRRAEPSDVVEAVRQTVKTESKGTPKP